MPDGSLAVVRGLDGRGMTLETQCDVFLGQRLLFELRPAGSMFAFTAAGQVESVKRTGDRSEARVRFMRVQMHARG